MLKIICELERTLKDAVVARVRKCPSLFLEGLNKTTKDPVRQDSRSASRNSNLQTARVQCCQLPAVRIYGVALYSVVQLK